VAAKLACLRGSRRVSAPARASDPMRLAYLMRAFLLRVGAVGVSGRAYLGSAGACVSCFPGLSEVMRRPGPVPGPKLGRAPCRSGRPGLRRPPPNLLVRARPKPTPSALGLRSGYHSRARAGRSPPCSPSSCGNRPLMQYGPRPAAGARARPGRGVCRQQGGWLLWVLHLWASHLAVLMFWYGSRRERGPELQPRRVQLLAAAPM